MMKQKKEGQVLIDLGAVSEATLGAKGFSTDLVREIPSTTGISDD